MGFKEEGKFFMKIEIYVYILYGLVFINECGSGII